MGCGNGHLSLAPDSEAERQFLPAAEQLRNKLLLAGRGYGAVPYFAELTDHGAAAGSSCCPAGTGG